MPREGMATSSSGGRMKIKNVAKASNLVDERKFLEWLLGDLLHTSDYRAGKFFSIHIKGLGSNYEYSSRDNPFIVGVARARIKEIDIKLGELGVDLS